MRWVAGGTVPRRTLTQRGLLVFDPETEELPVFGVHKLAFTADEPAVDHVVTRSIFVAGHAVSSCVSFEFALGARMQRLSSERLQRAHLLKGWALLFSV